MLILQQRAQNKSKKKEQKLTNLETAVSEENIRKYGNWKKDNILLAKISQIVP